MELKDAELRSTRAVEKREKRGTGLCVYHAPSRTNPRDERVFLSFLRICHAMPNLSTEIGCADTLRNQVQEPTTPGHRVPAMRILVFDFAVSQAA
eukprot:3725473-Rhodomonas_salina.5